MRFGKPIKVPTPEIPPDGWFYNWALKIVWKGIDSEVDNYPRKTTKGL